MATRKYFLGDNLLGEIRETIDVVSGTPRRDGSLPVQREAVQQSPPGQVFRIGTATGSWNKAATNTVTWAPGTGVTSTTSATNLFANITGTTSTYSVAIARVGNDWYLIGSSESPSAAVSLTTATATIVTDVSFAADLSTSDCSIVVTKTLTTALITYVVND